MYRVIFLGNVFANELQSSTTRFTAHIELNMEKYRKKSKLFRTSI